ncbi:hypothetical protein QAD02_005140 [Eretmocerus hayati]|uniref:Uncharacterized protein n=1 Tax=Eretmocerus hayati TaxID=131215 RepID=A0ACC2NSS3_9HYME|nr:hypothetical protein QAD02_005140 [Eretmocerus hayati]
MQHVALGCVILLSSTPYISGDSQFPVNRSLIAEALDLSWNTIRNTTFFEKVKISADGHSFIDQLDRHLDSYYDLNQNLSESPLNLKVIPKNMTRMMFYSKEISLDFLSVLRDRDFYLTRGTKDLPYIIQSYEIILRYVKLRHPLRYIESLVSGSGGASFFKQYMDIRNIGLGRISELQHMLTFLRYLRWVFAKVYLTVRYANETISMIKPPINKIVLTKYAAQEFSIENVVDSYDDCIRLFTNVISKASPIVYNSLFNEYKENVTFYQINIFQRMFIEKCYDFQWPHGYFKEPKQCALITSAPNLCKHLSAGSTCPVWFGCEKVRCEYLKEKTTVCLDQSHGIRKYEYFLPSHLENERPCDEFRWLRDQNMTSDGRPDWLCIPCKCICQKSSRQVSANRQRDRPYYYNKELVLTDFANNMVVVGAKLELIDDTLFIRVLQGRLLPNGEIDPDETNWLSPVYGDREEISIDGVDTIDLTQARADFDEVITGLGFTTTYAGPESSDPRMALQIFSHKYDSKNGRLNHVISGHKTSFAAKVEIHLEKLGPTVEQIIWNRFVRFTVSDGEIDGGRTTLPFISSKKVVPYTLSPLMSVRLYLRVRDVGPLVGLQLFIYDGGYSKYQ